MAVSLIFSCNNTKNATGNINPFHNKRESYFIRGELYWNIENKSPWQLDTAAYYFEKFLGDLTIKYKHPLTQNEECAFCWLPQIYYRRGEFEKLDAFTKIVMRFYSNNFRIVNSIWWNFAQSNSLYPHNPEFDKKYTTYFKNLTGFGEGGKYGVQKKLLEEVFDNDQKFRRLLLNKNNEFLDSIPKAIDDSIGRVDSMNIAIVAGIIDKYGWLGPKDVGVKAVMGEFYTIQHADRATFFKYYPIIKKAYRQQQLTKNEYELFIDRRQVYLHKPQIYGTQRSYDSTRGEWFTDPVKK